MSSIIEQTVARAAGKVGLVRAKFSGLDGVFRRLVEEHKQLAVLFARAEISSDPEKRAELWAQIRPELVAHERAEAEVVYSAAGLHPDLASIIGEHEGEEDRIHALVQNLDSAAFASAQWEGCLKQLHEAVQIHTAHEETDTFVRIQHLIGEHLAQRLEPGYLLAKKALIENL